MHLLFFTLFLWGFLAGQRLEDQLYFDHYSDVDGLSQVSVNSIVQDQKGFLWFGTQNGLNRFDGLEFRVFKKISGDTSSLSHNLVSALFCDSKNRIWVGTVVGTISVYEYQSNSFRQIGFVSLKP
ncbi:MAG: hypothetical protein KDD94_11545, partial [Calditrichaeota bacterium]|nr:hypothetical protein [Calditrichota bacterium]